MKLSEVKDKNEVLELLAQGLKKAAKSPNVNGYQPHDKQRIFHSSDAKTRQFIGGNRSGKTVAGAVEAVMYATGKHPYKTLPWEPPLRLRVVSVDFVNGVEKIVKPEIAKWMPLSELKGNSWATAYSRELRTLTLENGSTIEFMSYDQDLDKFAGTSRHAIWFDEEPPRDIWVECKMRTVDVEGHMWLTMTPVEGMTWTYEELYDKAPEDDNIFVIEVAIEDNPHLNQAEMDQLLSGLTEDEKKAREKGKYVALGGLIWPQFNPEVHVIDPVVPPQNDKWMHFAAMDHGFNNPTAWLWLAVDNDGRIIVYDCYKEDGRVVSWHAKKVKENNERLDRVPAYYVGDPSIRNVDPITGTSIQLEYIENGVPIVLGNNDVRAGIIRVAGYFMGEGKEEKRPKLYITRNCQDLIWEIQRYRWGRWATKKAQFDKNRKEDPHKKDDHACDALRYGIMSRPQVDDATSVPEVKVVPSEVGATTAVSATDTRDPNFTKHQGMPHRDYLENSKYKVLDDTLGSEW